ncbi:MAG: molybdenum cofactor guanylyltransferase [Actinomycetota bacterium]|nr:molybdenum cofactor guanylyltransferase [Actinomycetota bacterium]
MTVVGAVLSGGMSKRMGQNKADVLVRDQTMLEMVGTTMKSVLDTVVLLGPDRDGWECWPDAVHAHGPLAGIATALARTDAEHIFLLAVDHPFARAGTIERIVDKRGELPVVPVDAHGARQVTCALYPRVVADAAAEEAANGGSVQSLLDRVSFTAITPETWESWGEDGRSWYSVDSPEALTEGLGLFT